MSTLPFFHIPLSRRRLVQSLTLTAAGLWEEAGPDLPSEAAPGAAPGQDGGTQGTVAGTDDGDDGRPGRFRLWGPST